MDYVNLADLASSVTDVAQIAAMAEKTPAWLGGIMGMVVVMVALTGLWWASELTALYFTKKLPKKLKPSR